MPVEYEIEREGIIKQEIRMQALRGPWIAVLLVSIASCGTSDPKREITTAAKAARQKLYVRYAGSNSDIEFSTIEAKLLECASRATVPVEEAYRKADIALVLAPSTLAKDRVTDLLALLERPDLFAEAPTERGSGSGSLRVRPN